MPVPLVTIVIPTLTAGPKLFDCVRALEQQDITDWKAIIVDNSGKGIARQTLAEGGERVQVINSSSNVGFGGAVNRAFAEASAPFLAVLNDDAVPCRSWLRTLLSVIETAPRTGMCASRVLLADGGVLDSAGMLICGDGSSKQRGHLAPADTFSGSGQTLFPSGSAALYRREMLEEIGGFDESLFLYCEDTDLGLRARWAGWQCLYAPGAVVEHRYSQTAGAASGLKAYYVERNRIFVIIKCFPASMLAAAPFVTLARYFWTVAALWNRSGKAGEYRKQAGSLWNLVWIIIRAHFAALIHLPQLLGKRRTILGQARLSSSEFKDLLAAHSISARGVASL